MITDSGDAFANGLAIVAKLTDGPVYVCTSAGAEIACPNNEPFRHAEFSGPHPAGLVGTHIHFLEPVSENKTVWHLGYQDVIAIGQLFTSGRLPVQRVIALGGPEIKRPRLLRTRVGASIADLLAGETRPGRLRVISGSVLSGHRASDSLAWLGRYHTQISVLREGGEREFLAWAKPGGNNTPGNGRSPGEFLATNDSRSRQRKTAVRGRWSPLARSRKSCRSIFCQHRCSKRCIVEDTDRARELGCLELDEEDLALCSFTCNGKYEYGPFLRANLDLIEAHG